MRPGAALYSGGAVSIVDLKPARPDSGAAHRLGSYGWLGVDTLADLLFAEETIMAQLPDPDAPDAKSGMLYELKL